MKFIYFSSKILVIFIISSILLGFSSMLYFSSGLPDYKKLNNYQPPISSRVYSNDGKLIAEYAVEKRLFIPIESIPKKVINSFLSAEDKNFFKHPGIDTKGIMRAVIKNIGNIVNDKRLEGASTITQQVAKNFLLTNEVSLKRKIKEAILAFRIEKAYTKERILELYLNQIYLGEGTYGVAAASLEYFDKPVKDLNYLESSMLAALPKAPSKYNPYKYPKEAKFRRNLVLNNLFENKYISSEDFNKLKNKPILLKKRKIEILDEAKSFTEEVRREIKNKYGFDKLYKEGLSIKTPLDINYQLNAINSLREGLEKFDKRKGWRGPITNKIKNENWKKNIEKYKIDPSLEWKVAELINIENQNLNFKIIDENIKGVIFNKNLKWITSKDLEKLFDIGDLFFVKKENENWSIKQYPEIDGSIVVMDPFTGDVKALVGGYNFRSSEFNRATQANRQPGSAFKPFVYAAALENGYAPNTIVLDAPFIIEQGIGLKDWKPENYGKQFYGPSTLRKGIEYSRNLMTVRIAENLGLENVLKLSKNLNIYDEIPELLSVSLGSAETTLLNLVTAYSAFVNGGKKVNPMLFNKIQDRRGNTIFKPENIKCSGCDKFSSDSNDTPTINYDFKQVMSEQTAYQMTSILSGVIKRGTGKRLRDLKVPLAGKTGTTNNNFDAWFIGYTSNLVIGVYVGYDNPKTLGKFETGSKAALPIFKSFLKKSIYTEDIKQFSIPSGIYFSPINYDNGNKADFGEKNSIIEAFKFEDINNINKNELNLDESYDNNIKFRQFY